MMRNAQDKTKGMNDSQTKQVMDATTERFKREIGQEGPGTVEGGHQGQSGGHRSKQRHPTTNLCRRSLRIFAACR